MKTEKFKYSDGKEGERYEAEAGDEFVCNFAKVGERQNPAIVKGKAVIIKNYFLGVLTKDNKEVTIKITEGQKKVLDKTPDLMGKKIVFEEYTHKKYGKQVGARVLK